MSGPRAWLARLWRRTVVARVLISLARRDLRRGRLPRARARFQRVACIAPFSFQAHFGLACIHFRERDFQGARRELLLAREIAPRRYRACRARLPELVGRLEAATAPAPRPGIRSGSGSLPARVSATADPGGPPFPGDCVSRDEWTKFRHMGPISAGDVAAVDWDGVISALTSDEPPASERR